jgi:GT2 family glycosyltransferase
MPNKMNTPLGRLLRRYGRFKHHVLRPAMKKVTGLAGRAAAARGGQDDPYGAWVKWCEALRYDREKALRRLNRLPGEPVISLLLLAHDTPREHLGKTIDSVLAQYYPRWELCVCDDASTAAAEGVRPLLEEYAAKDSRIKPVFARGDGGPAATAGGALAAATGEFIGQLDGGDELTPDALLEAAATVGASKADLIYSDEDRLDMSGRRFEPFFKPAWSPDLLLSCNYVGRLAIYRRALVDQVGGLRAGFDGSEDYDLALRFVEKTSAVAHIPKILYHRRKPPAPHACEAARAALASALARRGADGEVERGPSRGYYRVRRRIAREEKVSIIIPTRDRPDLLRRCVSSIETKTTYGSYEIIIVDNGSRGRATLDYLSRTPHRVMSHDGPFNFSRLNNLAAREATGRYLLLLNDDTEVISPEWLSAMVEHAARPEVGAVGAKLLYPKGRIQHAGVVLGVGGLADHSHRHADGFTGRGYFNFPNVIRDYSAVTGACLMTRRELFIEAGGLNERDLAVAFNDVDLCLRLRRMGYLVVYTPYAMLYHREAVSRGNMADSAESAYLRASWQGELADDPYYNPNLSLSSADFEIDYSKPEALCRVPARRLGDAVIARAAEGISVGQEFSVDEDDLCAIGIRCAVGGSKGGKVVLRLREAQGGDLAAVELSAAEIRGGRYYLFAFDPVGDSAGKRLSFCVEFSGPLPTGALRLTERSVTSDAPVPHSAGRKPARGTLSFSLYCRKQFRQAAAIPFCPRS